MRSHAWLRPGFVLLAVVAALGTLAVLSAGRGTTTGVTVPTAGHRPSTAGGGSTTATVTGADGVVDERDGVLPDGVTVFDDRYAGVANLDADLLAALRAAADEAADEGIAFVLHSAWRSPEYQERLLRDAVAEHGSEEEAARWVAPPDRSLHVSGDAVDIDGVDAREWLSEDGAAYGLCRTYGNEPWHFELRPEAVEGGCPALYADPTHDPRLQP